MDKLDIIFEEQRKLDQEIIDLRHLDVSNKGEWIQKKTLAVLSELAELLDEVNFKWWKNPKELEVDKIQEEIVDIVHFVVSMCLTSGMSSEDLYSIYIKKNQENHNRQEGKSIKPGYDINQLDK